MEAGIGSPASPVLDTGQASAVLAGVGRPVAVVGDAGAGKTTAIVERVAHLLAAGVRKERMILLAVSHRSATELVRKLSVRVGADGPLVTTVHALAFNLVQQNCARAEYRRPPRRLYGEDAWQRLKRTLEREDPARWKRYGGALRSRTLLALVSDLLAGAANNALESGEIQALLEGQGRQDALELVGFRERYVRQMKEEGLLDQEGAVLEALRLLERYPEVASRQREGYRQLLVDEFENATYVQARIARILGGQGLFVAGNPNEGTNSYRGGSPAYLLDLLGEPGTRVIRLDGSHRAGPALRRFPGRLFERGSGAAVEDDHGAEGAVSVRSFSHQRDEASWLVTQVATLLGEGIGPGEVAILLRSASDPVGREVYRGLLRMGVPVRAAREASSVEGDPLVAAAVEVIRFLLAPEGSRNALYLRLLSSPLGELTPAEVRWLRRTAVDAGRSALKAALDGSGLDSLPPRAAEAATGLAARLRVLEGQTQGRPDELLWGIWATFPAFAEQSVAWGEGRWERCAGSPAAYRAFLSEAGRIVEDTPSTSAVDLLRLFDSGYFRDVSAPSEPGRAGGVTMTTVHQAQGREWRCLFVPNLVEGGYPLRQSAMGNLAPLLLRCGGREPEGVRERHLAEERRVLYVALSRARERIYLSYSGTALDGSTGLSPSRYLSPLGLQKAAGDGSGEPAADGEEMVARYRRRLARGSPEGTDGEGRMDAAEALYALGRLMDSAPEPVDPERWWENVAATEGADPPYPDGRLHLSASRLASYRDCPLAYMYGVQLRLEDVSSDAMTLGSLIHAVLEEYHRPGGPAPRSWEGLLELLERNFDPTAFSHRAIARQVKGKAAELLARYYSRYGQEGGAVAVEKTFRFPLGPHTVSGRIDRIDRLKDGSLELIDYKTGSPMSFEDARSDLQLALYAIAFQHDGELAALGKPSLVSYLYPRGIGKRATTDGKRSYRPTEEAGERLLARIARYSQGILAEMFPSRFRILDCWPDLDPDEVKRLQKSDPCRFCAFQWLCPEKERGMSNG